MTINVKVSSSNQVKARIVSDDKKINAKVASGTIMARTLEELLDVDVAGVEDKYVIMYDAGTGKYTAVNPDEVLSAATTEPIQPGLPANFENQLDIDLDNRIDLDAGGF